MTGGLTDFLPPPTGVFFLDHDQRDEAHAERRRQRDALGEQEVHGVAAHHGDPEADGDAVGLPAEEPYSGGGENAGGAGRLLDAGPSAMYGSTEFIWSVERS